MKEYDYENLVFEGGGVKGIAYLGMLEVLESNQILQSIKRIAGSSAGAITATLTCIGKNFAHIKSMADSLNFAEIKEKTQDQASNKIPKRIKKKIAKYYGDFQCFHRLFSNNGWYSSDYFYNWLKKQITAQFKPSSNQKITFADFQNDALHVENRHFKDLFVIGTDISSHKTRIFSASHTPDVEVANAVRISMSIPLFFESIDFKYPTLKEKHIFSDGGVIRNYPIDIFDSPGYEGNQQNGINWSTLGGHLYTPTNGSKPEKKGREGLLYYIENLFESIVQTQTDSFENSLEDKKRTVNICDMNIPTTHFDIRTGDKDYISLYNSGKSATLEFLKGA